MRVYNGNKINRVFDKAERVSVSNCGDRKCTLNVDHLQLDDAGFFACIRTGVDKQWSLTILGK